jgi:hypothetical protein
MEENSLMKLKFGALALGLLALSAIAIGAIGPATSAAADPESDSAQIDAAIATGDFTRLPVWLRHSVIACAAETIDVPVSTVQAGLLAGHSLKEIANRYGVRAPELQRGVLACEHEYLWRLVGANKLTRLQAVRVFSFLEIHIERIINYHFDPHDAALTDAATS